MKNYYKKDLNEKEEAQVAKLYVQNIKSQIQEAGGDLDTQMQDFQKVKIQTSTHSLFDEKKTESGINKA